MSLGLTEPKVAAPLRDTQRCSKCAREFRKLGNLRTRVSWLKLLHGKVLHGKTGPHLTLCGLDIPMSAYTASESRAASNLNISASNTGTT